MHHRSHEHEDAVLVVETPEEEGDGRVFSKTSDYGAVLEKQSEPEYKKSMLGGMSKRSSADDPSPTRSRELRAEVADTYAICSALLTGFCVCTIVIEHGVIEHERKADPLRYYALIAHQIIVRTCTGLAIFSTLVFMLTSMYLKTSLSRPVYAAQIFDEFSAQTADTRKAAFWCMYCCCILYMFSIPLGFFYTLGDRLALIAAPVLLSLSGFMIYHAHRLVDSAAVIFMGEEALHQKFANTPRAAEYPCTMGHVPTLA